MNLTALFGMDHRAMRMIGKAVKALNAHRNFAFSYYRSKLKAKHHIVLGKDIVIGNNLRLPHPQNIVIGIGTRIGSDCIIYQDVTMGKKDDGYPVIGDHVVIYPGAKIIGGVTIGNNAVIGANAVVVKDVPDDSIAAGVPAKIIRKREPGERFQ